MKTLQILLIIVLCATPLYAGQALVLTEIEQIQEKIWHIQRAVAAQNTSIEEQHKQLKLLANKTDNGRLESDKRLAALAQSISSQQEETKQIATELQNLHEALASLTNESRQENSALNEQTGKIATLERSLQALRAEFISKQTSTEQALTETRKQLVETRSQLDALGQNVGGRIEQIGLWGTGAALILAAVLTIVIVGRKSRPREKLPERKQPPRHEM